MTPYISSRRPALVAAATALALGGGLLLPAAPASAAAPPAAAAKSPSYDITLITGDVVHFSDLPGDGQDQVTVDRPAGAPGSVRIQETGGQLYVLPDEARSLLAADRIDRRLFNVTELVKSGYDDERSGGIPVIATGSKARGATPPAAPEGSRQVRRLASIGATALRADKDEARAFWKDLTGSAGARTLDGGVGKLWLDGRVKAELAESVPHIGAPEAWGKGFDGTGVKVAVLDTGIDATHPDVKDVIAASRSFIPGEEVTDRQGHGTHVASTIAGSGAASGGVSKGVAPGARLYVGKVLDDSGFGNDSEIIAGMEWAKEQGVDVVSMSLGSEQASDGTDPMAMAVDALSANGGPLYVIAAGNRYGEFTVGSPGAAGSALTVAAADDGDVRADFSSQGPLPGNYGLKPDISGPGVDVTAAASQQVPDVTGMYETMSGTSMATPHVAGAAAILKQRHPDWGGERIKNVLMSSSKKLDAYSPYSMGTGRVDIPAALDPVIEATGSVPTADFTWPHEAGETAERTITYRNNGSADTTLALSVDTDSPVYRLSAATLTVPAGGTAQVTLTFDPASLDPGAYASGQVVARSGGAVVAHTGFAVHKEDERYDVELKLTDRDGTAGEGLVALYREGDFSTQLYEVTGGSKTLRVPAGNYTSYWWPDMPGSTPDSLAAGLVIDPETAVDKNKTIHLDGTKLRRVSVKTDRPTADSQRRVDFHRTFPDGSSVREMWPVPVAYDELWVTPTEKPARGTFDYYTRWRQTEKPLSVTTSTGRQVDAMPQVGGTLKAGSRTLSAVYAGEGGPADYAGLNARGKAVVVSRSDAVDPIARATAAIDAGAALLLVVNDGTGRLSEWYGDGDVPQPLPIASVKRDAGAKLIADARSGRLGLSVRQQPDPSYLYDLFDLHRGAVPDRSLAYAPDSERDLARVENTFYGDRELTGRGQRLYIPAWGTAQFISFEELEQYPGRRTEWVTPAVRGAGEGSWYEQHAVGLDYDAELEERGPSDQYFTAGRTYRQDWFKPVQHPRFGTSHWGPFRQSNDYLQANVPMWSDSGAGHSGSVPKGMFDGGTTAELYQGDTLIGSGTGPAVYSDGQVPRERLPYRLVVDGVRDPQLWRLSTKVHSEWGFESEGVEGEWQEDIRLLNPEFDVDTDLAGDVAAGGRTTVGFSAATQEWLGDRVAATKAALWVSYDGGGSWQPVALEKTGTGRWTATFRTPSKPGSTVSLRARAEGPEGLSVEQRIVGAFGLK